MLKILGHAEDFSHWTFDMQVRRSRLRDVPFEKIDLAGWDGDVGNATALLVLGRDALHRVSGEMDTERWFHRVVWYDDIPAVVAFSPRQLRAYDNFITYENKQPGELVRPTRYIGLQVAAFNKALNLSTGALTDVRPPERVYTLDPDAETFNGLVRRIEADLVMQTDPLLAFDIETPYKQDQEDESEMDEEKVLAENTILRISFAWKAGYSVSVPFEPAYYEGIQKLLNLEWVPKAVWNGRLFDKVLLNANQMTVRGTIYDGMDLWHYWQTDAPKGLEFVSGMLTNMPAWKHLADAEPALYNAIDSDVQWQCVRKIVDGLTAAGLWENAKLHALDAMEVLDLASQNGTAVDPKIANEQLEEFAAEYAKLLEDAQLLVPASLKKQKLYVRKTDRYEYWSEVAGERPVRVCNNCGQENVSKSHPCVKNGEGQVVMKMDTRTLFHPAFPEGGSLEVITDYLKHSGFNPNSADQIKNYIRYYGHPMGKNRMTKNDSADGKHLDKLVADYGKDHPIYKLTKTVHQLSKALAIVRKIAESGGMVTTIYTNSPSTWRLAARGGMLLGVTALNLQNQGKRASNPYTSRVRKTIIPKPGRIFVQADSSSIEAVNVGYLMGDQEYISLAKRSIHAYLVCKKLGLEFNPSNVAMVKEKYEQLYDQMKRTVHGSNYGMTPFLMFMQDPELFPSIRAAQESQDYLFSALPRLQEWHFEVREEAKRTGKLTNPWGLSHYFFDVFTFEREEDGTKKVNAKGEVKIKNGKDANRAIAFNPQSMAGLFARENCVLLAKEVPLDWLPAHLTVHDGYCLDVPDNPEDVARAMAALEKVLTRPIPQMGGLQIGCEIQTGYNWKDMKTVKAVIV